MTHVCALCVVVSAAQLHKHRPSSGVDETCKLLALSMATATECTEQDSHTWRIDAACVAGCLIDSRGSDAHMQRGQLRYLEDIFYTAM